MIPLIRNENMKLYRRLRTWILIALLIAASILVSWVMKSMVAPQTDTTWKAELLREIEWNEQVLADDNLLPAFRDTLVKENKMNAYALEHDINVTEHTLWEAVLGASQLIMLVTILVVIVAGDSVAGEFSTGTIKLLLIRPQSRTKVLFSKYASLLLFSLLLLLLLFASSFVANGFWHGFAGVAKPYLYVGADGAVREGGMLLQVIKTYALHSVQLLMIVTLAFMISTVFRSSSLAIALSILVLFTGQGIAELLLYKYDWGKYFLFAHTDLTMYIEGAPPLEEMTPAFSVAVLAAYFVAFHLLAWTLFTKRDVAA